MEGAILRAGNGRPIVKYRDTLQSTVQKLLNQSKCRFGCGPRKHKFSHIHQVAPMCPTTLRHSAVSCAKTPEPIDLPFALST